MPNDKDGRKLKDILRNAGQGEKADQGEVNAAVGRSMRYFIPVMIFFFTVNLASALSLYWLVSGIVAIIQQHLILGQDEEELETGGPRITSDKESTVTKTIIEGEVIVKKPKPKKAASKKNKKRRR